MPRLGVQVVAGLHVGDLGIYFAERAYIGSRLSMTCFGGLYFEDLECTSTVPVLWGLRTRTIGQGPTEKQKVGRRQTSVIAQYLDRKEQT